MSELIADLELRVTDDATGSEYFVNVAAEPMTDGTWDAWLEFVPLDDTEPLLTDTETHQATRADVVHWATGLSDTYVQGAFQRAAAGALPPDSTETLLVRRRVATATVHDVDLPTAPAPGAIDPFNLLTQGEEVLRFTLRKLTRPELLSLIDIYDLNPAKLSLALLTTRQLVTFIATATSVQHQQGKG